MRPQRTAHAVIAEVAFDGFDECAAATGRARKYYSDVTPAGGY